MDEEIKKDAKQEIEEKPKEELEEQNSETKEEIEIREAKEEELGLNNLNKNIEKENQEVKKEHKEEKSEQDPETKEVSEKESKKLDKTFYISLAVLIGIIAIFIIGIKFVSINKSRPMTLSEMHTEVLQGEELSDSVLYNGYSFIKLDDMWYFQWQSNNQIYDIPLRFNPTELSSVSLEGSSQESFGEKEIYLTFDPDGEQLNYIALAAGELSLSTSKALNAEIIASCSKNTTIGCEDRPIVTCDSKDKHVIYLKQDPETKVILDDNCVIIQGNELELLKAVDLILYRWFRII